MKTLALVLIALLAIATIMLYQAPASAGGALLEYELACPSGFSPVVSLNSLDKGTGKWRANVCVSNSTGEMVCQMTNCTPPGAPPS